MSAISLSHCRKDKIFSQASYPRIFSFNSQVAQVFDDMLKRSIPFYQLTTELTVSSAQYFCKKPCKVYDLGCSTGSTLKLLRTHLPKNVELIGIDNSAAMLEKASEKLKHLKELGPISLENADIVKYPYETTRFFIANYTLQFLSIQQRRSVIEKIYKNLSLGGVLFLSEKVKSKDANIQKCMTQTYQEFKEANGYSKSEIERKKEALENVLIPLTLNDYTKLLKEIGFRHIEVVLKWQNFVSLMALK